MIAPQNRYLGAYRLIWFLYCWNLAIRAYLLWIYFVPSFVFTSKADCVLKFIRFCNKTSDYFDITIKFGYMLMPKSQRWVSAVLRQIANSTPSAGSINTIVTPDTLYPQISNCSVAYPVYPVSVSGVPQIVANKFPIINVGAYVNFYLHLPISITYQIPATCPPSALTSKPHEYIPI